MSGSINAVLGWENALDAGGLTVSAEEATLPAQNLRDPLGAAATGWQTPSPVTAAWVQIVPAAAVAWRAVMLARTNLSAAATMRVRLGDVATITSAPAYDSGTLSGCLRGQMVHLLPAAVTAVACRVDIEDAGNPDGFLNIPLIYAGPAWQMATNISRESAQVMADGSRRTETRGGQQHVEEGWLRRGWELRLENHRASDAEQRLLDLEFAARRGTNILCIPRPLTQPARDAVFGLAEQFTPLRFGSSSGALRSLGFTITERL